MPKNHEIRPIELGMRICLMLEHQRQHVPAVEYVERLMVAHNMSRATAYRYLTAACDVLGLVLPKADPAWVEERRAITRRLRGIKPGPRDGRHLKKRKPKASHPWVASGRAAYRERELSTDILRKNERK